MLLLVGPCMFFAPLLVLLIPVAIVLWPPSLVLVGLAWLLLWPFAAAAKGSDAAWAARTHKKLGRAFRSLLTPWTYFDAPQKAAGAPTANVQTDAPADPSVKGTPTDTPKG